MMDNNSYFSIDRLVEFGLSLGVAQQMVGMMNQYMQSMYIPGSIQTMPKPIISQVYYVAIDGKQVGPLNDREISQMISRQEITKDTLAWLPGMQDWQPIEQIPAILKIVALTPPVLPNTYSRL